jgi:hypothetical protein
MPRTPEVINCPYQIICEGPDDIAFFSRLVRFDGAAYYQLGCGKDDDGNCQGKDQFSSRIRTIQETATIEVKGFIIIADTDDNPKERFESACKHLKTGHLAIPKRPFEIATKSDGVRSAVIMVPKADIEGGLETLILNCSDGLKTHANCIEKFSECLYSPVARKIDKDKLRLRSMIAANYPKDPGLAISYWLSSKTRPFEFDHQSLSPIANFLKAFYQ